ncbi:MAG: HAD-IB family hydrolase [Acidimicrobiia bacterium]
MRSTPPARVTPVVAAFDFDGTLSTRDNFMPFLFRVAGAPAATQTLATSGVRVARNGRSEWGRDAVKAEVLRRIFADYDADRFDTLGREFASDIVRRHLRPEAVDRVDWHRTQGHKLVVVSASLGVYVRPVAERLRFDAVLATELELGPGGKLTGKLEGANVRGAEKTRRLDVWLGGEPAYVWAYGDSSGDRELWARADRPVRVTRKRRFARDRVSIE